MSLRLLSVWVHTCATAALVCACEAVERPPSANPAMASADDAAGDASGPRSPDAAAAPIDVATNPTTDIASNRPLDAAANDPADTGGAPVADSAFAQPDSAVQADTADSAQPDFAQPTELPAPATVEKPDTEAVFGGDEVRTITLVYTAADYAAQQQDLLAQLGTFNAAAKPVDPSLEALSPELLKACEGLTMGKNCSALSGASKFNGMCTPYKSSSQLVCLPQGFWPGDKIPGVEPPPALLVGAGGTPIFVPVTVVVGDKKWAKVRMRFKGNQSLKGAWSHGVAKLPFRLDFDHKTVGETKGQLFHGFEKLTFATGRDDSSMLRDKVASEILRNRGVPAPCAAYYRVNIDRGDGKPFYAGLHVAVEDPSDVLPARDLDAGDGNIYKPEGPGADWATFKQGAFVKKNNTKAADWADVKAAMGTLHAVQGDAAVWRKELEERFDTKSFLRWLAVNTAIGNLDAYGHSPQNYYLIGVMKEAGRLHWVPWDHNLAFSETPPPGAQLPSNFSVFSPSDVLHDDTNYQWPLIRKLLDDPEYRALYKQELAQALQGLYASNAFAARVAALEQLILPHIYGVNGEKAPYSAIPALVAGQVPQLGTPIVQFAETMRLAVLAALEKG